ncbi:tetratricopeptide repeat protein [Marinobacter sp. SS21]|uniref:tetratricopeptide repeat protein n=1 Tax=Marinobacter sp. SS21 TaxID=2979460 RepID=UPI00232DD3AB|nr:tetratricopeptide repeat protein [Marinobacter sp. SS21]MDC0661933.1 tetratricopeptide repeat protein [Marinobacter sp. SS21]
MKRRNASVKLPPLLRATMMSAILALGLAGCDDNNMSQEEIQYIGHLDQARFFQRQGELKASTLEARSAIELQPSESDPYFIIVRNLITAGDALNAERQLNQLREVMPDGFFTEQVANRSALLLAESQLMQREFDAALNALEQVQEPDKALQLEVELMRAKIQEASGRLADALQSYEAARSLDNEAVYPLIGLSRIAFANGDHVRVTELIAEAEQKDSEDPELWLWKAQVSEANRQWQKSEDAYIKALEDIGQYDVMTYRKYETMSALVRVLREQGKTSEAFVYEEMLAKSAPGTIKSNMAAARDAFTSGELETAARYLEEILEQTPTHEQSTLMLGMIRFRQGRVEEAEALLAPLAEYTDSTAVNKLLAATKLEMRDPEGARALLEDLESDQSDPDILALVGIASLASGDIAAGEDFIEKALELNPDNHNLRLRYASYLAQRGQPDKALDLTRQALEARPDLDAAKLLMIRTYVQIGDNAAATESATAWVKAQPDSIPALLSRGQLALESGDEVDAGRYFEQAAKAAPDQADPLVALGNLARHQGRSEAAQDYYRRALTLAPNNRAALRGAATAFERDQAIALMESILNEQPDAIGPKLVLLETALEDADDVKAEQLTAELMARDSEHQPAPAASMVATIYSGVGEHLMQEEKFDQARDVLNRGRILFPNNLGIGLQSAVLAFRSSDPAEARAILQDVKRTHPESPKPYIAEASYLESQQQYREASELFKIALSKGREPGVALAYARSLQLSGQPGRAIEVLESAVEVNPAHPNIQLTLALLYQGNNQQAQAQAAYEAVIDVAPTNALALNNLAWLYFEAGDERALALAKRAYEAQPESAAIADTYGWILFKAGNQIESVPILEKAHTLQPDADEIAFHLAEAYKATGQESKAKQVLQNM